MTFSFRLLQTIAAFPTGLLLQVLLYFLQKLSGINCRKRSHKEPSTHANVASGTTISIVTNMATGNKNGTRHPGRHFHKPPSRRTRRPHKYVSPPPGSELSAARESKPYVTHDIYNKVCSLSTYLPLSPVPPHPSLSNLTHWHLISWWVEDASPHQPCSVGDLFRLGHSSAIRAPPHTHTPLMTLSALTKNTPVWWWNEPAGDLAIDSEVEFSLEELD